MMSQLLIRPAAPADACAVRVIYEPYVAHTAVTFEYDVPSEAELSERIERTMLEYPFLILEWQGAVAGYAYASSLRSRAAYRWDAELSIYLAPDAVRQGLGTRLYRALVGLLRAQNIITVYACITTPGHASLAFHEAFGFTRLGAFPHTGFKNGSWHDIVWMECALRERVTPPTEFIPFSSLDPALVAQIISAC